MHQVSRLISIAIIYFMVKLTITSALPRSIKIKSQKNIASERSSLSKYLLDRFKRAPPWAVCHRLYKKCDDVHDCMPCDLSNISCEYYIKNKKQCILSTDGAPRMKPITDGVIQTLKPNAQPTERPPGLESVYEWFNKANHEK